MPIRHPGRLARPSSASASPRLRRATAAATPATTTRRDWPTLVGVFTAVVAAVGALVFNGISAMATSRQLDLSRDGQLTDRYSQAVEQLGSPSVEVRLGGIYALEQIMRDSPEDQPTIVEVLAAFVRGYTDRRASRSPTAGATAAPDIDAVSSRRPGDLLAALTVLGRRDTRHDRRGQYADLSHANLDELNLVRVNLAGVDLTGTSMRGTLLNGADLRGSAMTGVDLSGAHLRLANLSCAWLIGANLTNADLSDANLSRAGLGRAKLNGAIVTDANLTKAFQANLAGTTGTPRPEASAAPVPPCA